MEKEKAGTRFTPAYCNKFHSVAWDKACQINPKNPLAVAVGMKSVVEALELAFRDLAENGRITEPIEEVIKQVLASIHKEV